MCIDKPTFLSLINNNNDLETRVTSFWGSKVSPKIENIQVMCPEPCFKMSISKRRDLDSVMEIFHSEA